MLQPADLFNLAETEHAEIFEGCEFGWEALKRIKGYLEHHLQPGTHHRCLGRCFIDGPVCIGEGTVIEDGAMIKGPVIIGRDCQIRHNAYIRSDVIIGDRCVIGNSCELKHSLLFNDCQVPHFNYVGDSILGHHAHLGAGVKISNVKLVPGTVTVEWEGKLFDTGLRKFGALLGDNTDIGCNAVLNPGSIIGRNSVIYANTAWRGVLPANQLAKNKAPIEVIPRRETLLRKA
ncbi:MAG: UDP-N-acetylglucosamine diphosphorylase [Candidatus Omnitrophica bacterium]|nr:UDP-N-acetylglucosamine diphosphorylase [Candidatus Omnitrophota bacterium]